MKNVMVEDLARSFHEWYLEATKKLNPDSYNPKAQKKYDDLTKEQKFIDKYIAKKILKEWWLKQDDYDAKAHVEMYP